MNHLQENRNWNLYGKKCESACATAAFWDFSLSYDWVVYLSVLREKHCCFSYAVSGCISVALLLAMLISSALGTCIPLFFKKINIDPAVTSGPADYNGERPGCGNHTMVSAGFLLEMLHLAG